eukprot:CAMPEP_0115292428 /NCGR_PEP_ID=MMETSP0270-20121206/65127_2 /TAXON_ID=71861 /ORGANISM="Scrippsiella trochoidea, Strain CCMP3099" /LENGTH=52 /DNA_ID=CAMNT_0002709853 /DNA_START=206 /DNA_END=361 /DNA_ORIENTATION=-
MQVTAAVLDDNDGVILQGVQRVGQVEDAVWRIRGRFCSTRRNLVTEPVPASA